MAKHKNYKKHYRTKKKKYRTKKNKKSHGIYTIEELEDHVEKSENKIIKKRIKKYHSKYIEELAEYFEIQKFKVKHKTRKKYKRREKRKKRNARKRNLGYIPLNNYFEGSEAHHIDKEYVIYIPRKLHRIVKHNVWTGEGMEYINELAFKFLYGDLVVYDKDKNNKIVKYSKGGIEKKG